MPVYLNLETDVIPRLQSKIFIGGTSANAIALGIANEETAFAESEVENTFAPFYAVPFSNIVGGDWTTLSQSSQALLKKWFLAATIVRLTKLYFNGLVPQDIEQFYKSYFQDNIDRLRIAQSTDGVGNYMYQGLLQDVALNPSGRVRTISAPITGNIGGYDTTNSDFAIANVLNVAKSWQNGGWGNY